MLTLLLLRHAKAGPQGHDGDFARPLLKRGRTEAKALGAFMASKALKPDVALVSAAVRTRETYEQVDAMLASDAAVDVRKDLYSATATDVRALIAGHAGRSARLLVVGHNPAIQEAAINLARDGDLTDIARMRAHFPPCALAAITFDAETWEDAMRTTGRLDLFLTPDDLILSD